MKQAHNLMVSRHDKSSWYIARPLSFCSSTFLPKRPRSTVQLISPTSVSPISFTRYACRPLPLIQLSAEQGVDNHSAVKVPTTQLDTDPDIPTNLPKVLLNVPSATPVLPVTLDLLNYHARASSRRTETHSTASKIFRRCISLSPTDGRAWLGLARLHSSRGDIQTARRIFREAIKICRNNPFLFQAWGVLEERQEAFDRAKGLYLTALRIDQSHAPAWVSLALWHYRHAKDNAAARLAFQQGTKACPNNYYIWHAWGVLEKNCRRFPAARDCFQKGIAVNPSNAATYVLWGSLEDECSNHELAMKLFDKAHAISPNNLHAYLSHAVAAERSGDVRKARNLLKRAIEIRPNVASSYQALGLLEYRAGNVKESRKAFKLALEKDSRHFPTWHAWARIECALGNLDHARKLFQESIWIAPRSPNVVRTWHAWASMEMDVGRYEIARRYFFHGLDVDERSVPILIGIAKLEAKEGNMQRAREYMEKCVHFEPWRQSMWRSYQQLEIQNGSSRRAQLVYERSVVVGQQVEERFNLSDPLPGDFQGIGMWFDALELPPDKSAFDSVGAEVKPPTKKVSQDEAEYAGSFRRISVNKYRERPSGSSHRPQRKSRRGYKRKTSLSSDDASTLPPASDGDRNVSGATKSSYR